MDQGIDPVRFRAPLKFMKANSKGLFSPLSINIPVLLLILLATKETLFIISIESAKTVELCKGGISSM
jgi:hypothetical protein